MLFIISVIVCLVIELAPIVLYFRNRKKTNFAEEIKIIAIIDIVSLLLWGGNLDKQWLFGAISQWHYRGGNSLLCLENERWHNV